MIELLYATTGVRTCTYRRYYPHAFTATRTCTCVYIYIHTYKCCILQCVSLLNRGWVFAIAHVRGGGERGKRWYDQGKQLQKGNTFNDVITCAEGLIDRGFTQAGRLSIQGYSAGGLAAAAAIQKKPSLFTAAVLRVPFLDVLGSMMDEDLPLTKHERDEWGDPIADKDVFDLIKSYCPYRNINSTVPSAASPASSGFPSVLVTASFQDPRVSYSVPAKWVARMRRKVSCTHPYTHTRDMEHQSTAPMDGRDSDGGGDSASPSSSSLMLVTSFEGGHFGDNSSMNSYDEDTRDFAFFIHHDNEKAKQNP